jgi:Domain of unknown function (DUF4138)
MRGSFRRLVLREVMTCVIGLSLLIIGLSVRAQEPGFHLEGMASRSLPVTGRKMTNVIFPIEIAAGVRVSRDVLVQKVKGVENVIELKALKRDFASTNLSVYGKDGRLYSFVLHYVEDTTVLDYRVVSDGGVVTPTIRLSGWPVAPEQLRADGRTLKSRRGFLHRRAVGDGLQVALKGIYLQDSLLWLSLNLHDRTAIGLSSGSLRIYTEDKKRVKRTATQELDIIQVYFESIDGLPGMGSRATAVALHPFVVGHGKRVVIEVSDREGDRKVVLRVKGKTLMRARKFD